MDKNEGWKNILKGAEAVPSDFVWDGLEANLDKMELMQLRKSVVYHRWLAAAGVILALVASGMAFWWTSSNSTYKSEEITEATQEIKSSETFLKGQTSVTPQQSSKASGRNYYTQSTGQSEIVKSEDNQFFSKDRESDNSIRFVPFSQQWISDANNFRSDSRRYVTGNLPVEEATKKEEEKPLETVAFAEVIPEEVKKENKHEERFWTSVGVSAGTFTNATPNGVSQTANALQSFDAGKTAASETNSPGYTYAVNVGVGTRISKRVMLLGGISYLSQQTDYTATTVISDHADQTLKPASMNAFEKKAEQTNSTEAILTSTPYKVNNNIQLISFPMQAAYLLIDKKVSLQINSGFSTDLFLQNTITPYANNLEKTTQGRGDDSPYRPVNFSGLVGTELSYKFADNYRIAISPGLRYPINSIYKSDLGVESSPLAFDMAVRFRYIFR